MIEKPELLPCPFCGKEPRYVTGCYVDNHGNDWPFAECDPCHVGSPVEFWNTRASPAEDFRSVGDDPVVYQVKIHGMTMYWDIPSDASKAINTPLYRHPQRQVVFPERRKVDLNAELYDIDSVTEWHRDCEWNACIEEFERMNK